MSETWPSLLAAIGIAILGSTGIWAYIKLHDLITTRCRRH